MRINSACTLFLLLLLIAFSCIRPDPDLDALTIYRDQLSEYRKEFTVKEMPDVPFFLFGMGNRVKLLYKDGKLIHSFSGEVFSEWDIESETIIPNLYKVKLVVRDGRQVIISEDEHGIYLQEGKEKELIEGTNQPLILPDFRDHRYSEILKVLHQEILVNIYDSKPVPNYFVYRKPWRRDAAMMAMCLEQTGNLNLIRDWVLGIRDPYDHNNQVDGIPENEADNLGQTLYLVSLFADSLHPVVSMIVNELPAFEVAEDDIIFIRGRSDFQEVPVYQTKWLKFGLKALGMQDAYDIPLIPDQYSSLFWWDYHDAHIPGKNEWSNEDYPYIGWARDHFYGKKDGLVSNREYPLTWEINASQASYNGMEIIDNKFVELKTSLPHTWHAAEIFLYLLDESIR